MKRSAVQQKRAKLTSRMTPATTRKRWNDLNRVLGGKFEPKVPIYQDIGHKTPALPQDGSYIRVLQIKVRTLWSGEHFTLLPTSPLPTICASPRRR